MQFSFTKQTGADMSGLSLLCIAFLVFATPNETDAPDQQQHSPTEQEVLNASAARRDAYNRRDFVALDRYIADDCLISTDDGVLVTKAELLKHLKILPIEYDRIADARDFIVRVRGSVAVVTLRSTAHEQFTDTDIITEQRRTETWVKRDAGWLLIAVQTGNLPVNYRKPTAVDPAVYKDYVGQYEWRPRGDVDLVSLKEGKLWSHFDNDDDEYLPLGSDSFFIKNDLGSITFIRDPESRVTGYTYHRVDGQEVHVKRIK
jgi:ketosteroid isomerase-like protein